MSRLKHFTNSLVSGYAVLGVNGLFTLASVPLALHYLSQVHFGLWALIASVGTYLAMIDLGMSGAVARLLVDHKDEPSRGTYGSLIKTGWLVSTVQGAIILAVGFALAPLIGDLLGVVADAGHPQLRSEFIGLLRWQAAGSALGLSLGIFTHVLWAHQRLDVVSYGQITSLVVNFLALWFFFHAGFGVYSMVWAGCLGQLTTAVVMVWQCCRLGLLPPRGAWGGVSGKYFREMFNYGKDLFLVLMGTQMVLASQTMIITRRLGLAEAARWSIGMRAFGLVGPLVSRIVSLAAPALSEMLARGEMEKLRARFKDIAVVSAAAGGLVAVCFVAGNSLFVRLWTHGRMEWSTEYDLWLALWLVVLAVANCNTNLILMTRRIGFLRHVLFGEGCVFIVVAWLASRSGGLAAVAACAAVGGIFFSGAYGIWWSSRYLKLSVGVLLKEWLSPLGKVLGLFVPVMLLTWWAARPLADAWRLLVLAGVGGVTGGVIFLRYGLPRQVRGNVLERTPGFAQPLLRAVFG